MLAAPLFQGSIFPLNADAFGFCVEGCELSIGGAASLLCKIAELWSLPDCVGSSGFHEPLVVPGIINHCFAGISSVSCPHVGEPNGHTDSTHIGHEHCVTACTGSVCSNVSVVDSTCSDMSPIPGRSVCPLTWGPDRFVVPSFCQLLCNHGPSRRSRRSSLAGLCSDSVGGVANASSSWHNSSGLAPSFCHNSAVGLVCAHDLLQLRDDGTICVLDTCPIQSPEAVSVSDGCERQKPEHIMACNVEVCSISDLIVVFGCSVCSIPSIRCIVSEPAPPEYFNFMAFKRDKRNKSNLTRATTGADATTASKTKAHTNVILGWSWLGNNASY